MIGRRRKLYFQKTASKIPIIIFSISVLIGVFFLFRIISTLVRENESTVEFIPVETEEITPTGVEAVSPDEVKPVIQTKPHVSSKSPVSAEFYTIQVATFQDKNRAENLIKQLKGEKYSDLYIKTRGKWSEVCVGRFKSYNQAEGGILLKLRKDFPDAFPRKLQLPFEEK